MTEREAIERLWRATSAEWKDAWGATRPDLMRDNVRRCVNGELEGHDLYEIGVALGFIEEQADA